MSDLTDKQRLWVEEYLICWNATEAVRRAGYVGSYDVLRRIGSGNLQNPELRAIIEERIKTRVMTADEVLARLADIARGNMADFITINGQTRIDLKKAQAEGKLHLVKSFTKVRGGYKIELYDAQAALVQLGKALGVLTERHDFTSGGQPIKGYAIVSPDDWDDASE